MATTAFRISIPDSELSLLQSKLKLTRFPPDSTNYTDDNSITTAELERIRAYWLTKYGWREVEAELNQLDQFTTPIEVSDGFGTIRIHYIHALAEDESGKVRTDGIPLLFVHGWPGSCFEVSKGVEALNEAGFHVVAPSLPGYGFSEYPRNEGYDTKYVCETLLKLMDRLGYAEFVVQGGDWGSHIARGMTIMGSDRVVAMHCNMFETHRMDFPDGGPAYTPAEKERLSRTFDWFKNTNSAYGLIHASKPHTLGFAMHDSPMGLLAWIYDKLVLWTDDYPWTPREIITWTLLHYFPGPTTAMMMYHENAHEATCVEGSWAQKYIKQPCGFSVFPKELAMMPRSWVERLSNVRFWKEYEKGGHFAMHERADVLVPDMVEFFEAAWKQGAEE